MNFLSGRARGNERLSCPGKMNSNDPITQTHINLMKYMQLEDNSKDINGESTDKDTKSIVKSK